MSVLAKTTERKAVTTLKKVLPYFDRLDTLAMTAEDSFDATTARRLIQRIIESNPEPKTKPKK